MSSVFLKDLNEKERIFAIGLFEYGPKICSYLQWTKPSGIPMKFDDDENADLIYLLCDAIGSMNLYMKQDEQKYNN